MAQVVLEVNGHSYTMQCNDGEEDHLRDLGEMLDSEVAKIKSAVGQVGDIRLLLMAGLVISDNLSDAVKRVEELQDQINGLRQARSVATKQDAASEDEIAGKIEAAAGRVEAIARELAS